MLSIATHQQVCVGYIYQCHNTKFEEIPTYGCQVIAICTFQLFDIAKRFIILYSSF